MAILRDEMLVFALDAQTRALRHVREVKKGFACGCICPGCEQPLQAVNSEAEVFVKRPHFRHPEGHTLDHCAEQGLLVAITQATRDVRTVTLPPIIPGAPLIKGVAPPEGETRIERIEILSFTEAMLILPDGRQLRVNVVARDRHDPKSGNEFELELRLPAEKLLSLGNVDDLRNYLTLDASAWRWCARQTSPGLWPRLGISPPVDINTEFEPDDPLESDSAAAPDELTLTRETTHRMERGPVDQPPIRIMNKDGSGTILRRQRWPNGIVTETVERFERDQSPQQDLLN